MKVDYARYPDIPPGCSINFNKDENNGQVYKDVWVPASQTGTGKGKIVRKTVGVLKNGVFTKSQRYVLTEKIEEQQKEIDSLKEQLQKQVSGEVNPAVTDRMSNVVKAISSAKETAELDGRKTQRFQFPLEQLALVALMSALTGKTESTLIAEYAALHRDFFQKYLNNFNSHFVSHDTVRRLLLLAEPTKFDEFFGSLTAGLIRKTQRVLAADGQAVRATGRRDKEDESLHGTRMLMNIYDTANRVCVAHELIDKKTNEITVGPKMLENLNINGCIVTADAMSCQVNFAESVINGGADYLLSLKGNQDKSWKEVISLFVKPDPNELSTFDYETELDHGRIEQRKVSVLSAKLLPKVILEKWSGLAGGSIVRIDRARTVKVTGKYSTEDSYYISSLSATKYGAQIIGDAVRTHWGVENRLHYLLDMYWNQDGMQAKNADYIRNRSGLNKLSLALLENYRYWMWNKGLVPQPDSLSIKTLQTRCAKPEVAIECLAVGLCPELYRN